MTVHAVEPAGPGRSYSGRSPDERDAVRRARVLAAALELIGTRGYVATTIERLCTTANVSTRHFYLLYANKEAAFIDLYDELTATSYRNVAASLEATSGKPLKERIAQAVLAYFDPMLADLRVARISFVEIIGASPRIEELRLRYRERLVDLVRAETAGPVARGEVRDRDFRFATLALAGAATAVAHDWMLKPDRAPVQQLERQLMELATDLIVN
jgi:AcrR family transcriptional regulator